MFIQEMSEAECLNALRRVRLGRLACAHENQPYIVPIYFVYSEPHLYGFTTLGQKVEWMRSNPLVCVEVDEVDNTNQWVSILIFGQYEELAGALEGDEERRHETEPRRSTIGPMRESMPDANQPRRRAHELLQEHAEWWEPAYTSGTHRHDDKTLTTVFYRIHIDRITGRRATPGPGEQGGVGKTLSVGGSPGILQRVVQAFLGPVARAVWIFKGRSSKLS